MCMITCAYVYVMCNHLCVEGGEKRERVREIKKMCRSNVYFDLSSACVCRSVSHKNVCFTPLSLEAMLRHVGPVDTSWHSRHVQSKPRGRTPLFWRLGPLWREGFLFQAPVEINTWFDEFRSQLWRGAKTCVLNDCLDQSMLISDPLQHTFS